MMGGHWGRYTNTEVVGGDDGLDDCHEPKHQHKTCEYWIGKTMKEALDKP